MSNAGVDSAINALGGKVIRTAVGDKNVIDEMLKNGYNLGGEQSGHLIFRDYASTGDGLVAALQILRIMKSQQRLLSALSRGWTRYPQVVTNIKVREKTPFKELEDVLDLVDQCEKAVQKDGGRVLLRYSGTEPKARLLIEGRNKADLESWSVKIADSIKRQIGVNAG
jgi:phosphoglucosamine mutase